MAGGRSRSGISQTLATFSPLITRLAGPSIKRLLPLSLYPSTQTAQLFLSDRAGAGDFTAPRFIAYLGPGRTLGARFDAESNLILCNAPQGLMKLSAAGAAGSPDGAAPKTFLLTSEVSKGSPIAAGRALPFVNSVDIAGDGTIYFSHSTDMAPFP
jgi:hypothetical protein